MFGKSLKLFVAIAAVASIAVIVTGSATAGTFITDTLGGNGHARHAVTHVPIASTPSAPKAQVTCQTAQAWTIVVDDQGLTWFQPVGRQLQRSCAASSQPSRTPGWTSVTDDLGVPWLQPMVARSQGC